MKTFNDYILNLFTEEQVKESLNKVVLELFNFFKTKSNADLPSLEEFTNKSYEEQVKLLKYLEQRGYSGYDCGFTSIYIPKRVFETRTFYSILNLIEVVHLNDDFKYYKYSNRYELIIKLYDLAEENNLDNLKLLMSLSNSQSVNFKTSVYEEVIKVISKDNEELGAFLSISNVMD